VGLVAFKMCYIVTLISGSMSEDVAKLSSLYTYALVLKWQNSVPPPESCILPYSTAEYPQNCCCSSSDHAEMAEASVKFVQLTFVTAVQLQYLDI
jgi:hypothetical protein